MIPCNCLHRLGSTHVGPGSSHLSAVELTKVQVHRFHVSIICDYCLEDYLVSCPGCSMVLGWSLLWLSQGHMWSHFDAGLLSWQELLLFFPGQTISVWMLSVQFFLSPPTFCFVEYTSQYTASFGSLLSVCNMCLSHLSLFTFTVRSNFWSIICFLTSLFWSLSFQKMPTMHCWNLRDTAYCFQLFHRVVDRSHSSVL